MARKKPTTKKGKRNKMAKVMREAKEGKLRSGSAEGPKVTDPKQAIAIGLSESGQSKKSSSDSAKKKNASTAKLSSSKRKKLANVTF